VPEEIGPWVGWDVGGVGGDREQVGCAMGVGVSTLIAGVRVKLTFGCAMGAATLGAGGRLKLTLLGVWLTLGSPEGLAGLRFSRRRWLGIGATVGLAFGSRAGD
jgi:hypothetical protein